MKRNGVFALIWLGLAAVGGCSGDDTNGGATCSTNACAVRSECAVGSECVDGCCAISDACCNDPGAPCACSAGAFCAADLTCATAAETCGADAGCTCAIVDGNGQIAAGAIPGLALASGGTRELEAVLATADGTPVPGATFAFAVSNTNFSVSNTTTLTADAVTSDGTATLTATAQGIGGTVTCTASLLNLGAATDLRVYVFDSLTGAPVTGATVVVQDTSQPTGMALTDGGGGVYTSGQPASVYNLTVFSQAYDYVSIVGLDPSTTLDVSVPLSVSATGENVGAFSGRLDRALYQSIAGTGDVAFGLMGASFPTGALLSFNPGLLFGGLPDVACAPNVRGCYPLSGIPFTADTLIPLPDNVELAVGTAAVKDFFDVAATPGGRHGWALGGEVNFTEIPSLLSALLAVSLGQPVNLDLGSLLANLVPLLPQFASAVQANLSLPATPLADWQSYQTCANTNCTFDSRTADSRFPVLATGSPRGPLVLEETLRLFTDFEVPNLPQDPALASGQSMESLVLLSGVVAEGFGFVPLGLGLGLDCTDDSTRCGDRAANPTLFDGVVNGVAVCPATGSCPLTVPKAQVQDGHVALFRAPAHSGLQGQPWLTLALALPINGLTGTSLSINALVLRGEPAVGDSDVLGNRVFSQNPILPANVFNRTYDPGDSGHDLHWVTFVAEDAASNTATAPWTVYFAGGDPPAFTPPEPPAALARGDAFQGVPLAMPMNTTSPVAVTHVGIKLTEGTFSDLAANNGTTFSTLFDRAEAFSVVNRSLLTEPAPVAPPP